MYTRGVYIIKNLYNGFCYIGSSNMIELRIESHFVLLNSNTHYNKNLQKDYNKFKKYFVFGVVKAFDILTIRDVIYDFEQEVLDKVTNKYNILLGSRDHLEGIYKTKNMKKEVQLKLNFEKYGGSNKLC